MIDAVDITFLQAYGFDYVETIGRGSFGVIYKVYSHQYQMNFALKRVLAEQFHDNEIDCMIQIRSACIVTLYKYWHHKEYVYLLMEYCPNSIDKILSDMNQLPVLKIYQLALGLTASVNSCHENHITHGDIKPSNFLIDQNGRVKICDFGLARRSLPDENSTAYSGTLMFLSPEIISKQPFDAYAADIWALGVTLYYLLTHKWPWVTDSKQAMYQSIVNCWYNEEIIPDLFFKKLIRDCLNLDPAKRPTSADIMKSIRGKIEKGTKKIIRPLSIAMVSNSLILSLNAKRRKRLMSN
ncbi:CAMK family protein kinase [Trichomonas vaginalis G3]|uniref:CAMK family protein kinase n=1 Tax=Trichomonas vaginalis (strain ATCC PRA-98 / G3) TaxID=412133 RepID=A2F1M9_TRIV3|nr:positive regulation of hh target transcription factor protein [Trichomonas vaginalis G3]EAY01194.1 CAMK family protein kinase [Trichomonas vaginalis G3]KAI5513192.1 positive regulation of hh target transcription factor protein [Trichomonas vaginalis G3]|eukprot:XP_001314030.1 CAMK family protein kinase [Trichomonas vaginalis G3]